MSQPYSSPVFHLQSSPSSSAQSSPVLRAMNPELDVQQHAAASSIAFHSPPEQSFSSSKIFSPSKPELFDDKVNPKLWLLGFKNYCLAVGVPADKVVRFAVS